MTILERAGINSEGNARQYLPDLADGEVGRRRNTGGLIFNTCQIHTKLWRLDMHSKAHEAKVQER